MYAPSLTEAFGNEINGAFGASAGTDSPGNATFKDMFASAGFEFLYMQILDMMLQL